jgi:PAS domain S-box-containing protein
LRTLIDNLPNSHIFVKDTHSRFITTNAAHLKTIGAKILEDVIGKTDFDLFPQELAAQYYADEQEVIRSGQPLINREELVIDKAGNRRWLLTTKAPLRDSSNSVVGIVGMSRDITDLKGAYALLEQRNKELQSFVYTVSHDLKAPLVSLEGFSSMLIDKYKESLDETGQLYLSRIQANAQKMGDLIQDLLELSRIGRVVHDYEPVDVMEIIQEAIETLQIQLSERGTELVIHDNLPTIVCDRVRIKQVFLNLIDNANKFMGEENQKPRIEIGFHAESPDADRGKGDFFEFFVKDNGIGIKKEYHEKVFEIFTRLGDVQVEGTGVGLAIVKKIIETHGGKIWLDSEVGKGTTVYFTLPKSSYD